jgi:hypothetical protein
MKARGLLCLVADGGISHVNHANSLYLPPLDTAKAGLLLSLHVPIHKPPLSPPLTLSPKYDLIFYYFIIFQVKEGLFEL